MLFNIPPTFGNSKPSSEIQDDIVGLIDSSVAGSCIYFSYYIFSYYNFAKALVRAHKRGVHVYGAIDSFSKVSGAKSVTLVDDNLPRGNFRICPENQGCIGPRINHNKYILFSELIDGRKSAVVQGSANAVRSHYKKHNFQITIANDVQIYNHFTGYFNEKGS